ncbi:MULTISPECIES: HhoA/HhoB/HtrA family serine endopeptidase [Aphanizomenonaceae]|jgi:S1-C subfamily serine protease|uniref:Trypsin-like peptidase domain-containing protein n=1 Tax=Dolichospermum heterosporum TAC447 TaxID=747523 RepID=A0ABY5M407_9CYAN|nr:MULTISPECIES: HhoA/HhoB/HtrA family serine endopeptidase [Aphanizomenonaceae]MDK2412741.1 HhoA/HhoB/HtrA family serine endopeptidase [Aphanizomenon sp. 202]MDK2458978.1 HhoA/HhoB/HtrA family serine endopeptidase [Aphanizomenon sp. PH219]MBE9258722.1 trypsin-like peptidase domain-containing protein [Dolichospermum sp. LEGE 00246]MTJ29965.1 trypsin-like serine protease [Aphanizomenon sp. UHCC 0183]UUO17506.1 trypsin-like peptidase domain-containing protein [Dolichospermum heterosporum TAC447]
MRFFQMPRSIRQLSTHVLAIFMGVVLTVTSLRVLPSAAEPGPNPVTESFTQVAQKPSSATAVIGSHSFVTAAVNRVGAAVVRIDTERTITRRNDPMMEDPFFRRFFGDSFPQQSPTEQLRGLGSGFILDKSGVILTNAHVVDKADKVTVRLKDGRTFEGKVKGIDEVTDLAVVKINAGKDLPVAPLGASNNVQVGDWAIAVGNPLGFDNTVTLGIVSTLKRSSAQVGISDKRLDFIQTDAAINPGNSGGPLLNGLGEVIGINTAIRADAMGIGFAIPIDKAKAIAVQLQRDGKVAHPYLGVQMVTLTPELAKQNNNDPNSMFAIPEVKGVLVMRVVPNSPAATAGIRRGDVIVQIDSKEITSAEQLQGVVEDSTLGQALQIKVQRGNQTQMLSVRTAELKDLS